MKIAVIGATFVDIKGFPSDSYIPTGRNVGRVEYIHGGVARNVVEDIANVELRPIFLGIVDDTPMGQDVVRKLQNHKVCTDYILTRPDGMGTWLAVFDNNEPGQGQASQEWIYSMHLETRHHIYISRRLKTSFDFGPVSSKVHQVAYSQDSMSLRLLWCPNKPTLAEHWICASTGEGPNCRPCRNEIHTIVI